MEMRLLWNPERESLSGKELRALQLEALRRQLRYLRETSTYYRQRLDRAGVDPERLRSLEDIAAIPCFDKEEHRRSQEASLREHGHPFGLHLCAPQGTIRAINATSGTTGLPTFYTFTEHDLLVNDEVLARAFWRIGLRPGDRALHGFALSMFVGGTPFIRALQAMGVATVPVGAEGGTGRLLQFARLVQPTALICTPSFAEHLIERAEAMDSEVGSLGIRFLICGGEPGAGDPSIRGRLEEAYGAEVFDTMGGAWGFFMVSCREHQGMHVVSPDLCLVEAVDPETRAPLVLEDGAVGEMTFTSLDWEAGPILRYDMGDTVELITERCPCGLPGMRVRLLGRTDDMLIVGGVNVYPSAVRKTIAALHPRVTGAMRIVLEEPGPRVPAPLLLLVERGADADPPDDEVLRAELELRIRDLLRFRPKVELVPAGSLERSGHKTSLVVHRQPAQDDSRT